MVKNTKWDANGVYMNERRSGRIGINAGAVTTAKGGAGFHIVHITSALVALGAFEKCIVFCSRQGLPNFASLHSNCKVLPICPSSVLARLIWEQTVLPFLMLFLGLRVLLSPNYSTPLIHFGFKNVVTIFDLSFFPLRDLYPRSRQIFRYIIHLSVRVADEVIAISEHTRRDILKYIGPYSDKISVVHCGVDDRFKRPSLQLEITRVREKYGIDTDYILFTGFLEPRKNLGRLLEAYAHSKDLIRQKLVIAGGQGWWYERTYAMVKNLGISSRVVFTGYVPDEDLPPLYSGATLFVFLSLYEGFGIAPLEAVCCGTPVLASGNTCLPEVLGKAACYVDPYNTKEIESKLAQLLNDPDELNLLRSACEATGASFSWKKAAYETSQILLRRPGLRSTALQ